MTTPHERFAAGQLAAMKHEGARLFTRLAPVLNVRDLAAERTFYEALGLPVIYEGPELPDFIGCRNRSGAFRHPEGRG